MDEELKPWQKQMIDEKIQMEERIDHLEGVIAQNGELGELERIILLWHLTEMKSYLNILNIRITYFAFTGES